MFNKTILALLVMFAFYQQAETQTLRRMVLCERSDGSVVALRRCTKRQTRIVGSDLRQPGPQGERGPTGPQGIPGNGPAFFFSGSTDFDELDETYKFFPVDGKLATGELTATAVEPESPLVNSECSRLAYRLTIDKEASPDGVVIIRLIRVDPFTGGIDGGDSFLCSISSGSTVCSGETELASAVQPGDKLAVTVQHPGALTTFSAAWSMQCTDHLR